MGTGTMAFLVTIVQEEDGMFFVDCPVVPVA